MDFMKIGHQIHFTIFMLPVEKSKFKHLKKFMDSDESIIICTHATLRFAFDQLDETKFNDTLLAIDEFHHVSTDGDNRLGELLRAIMDKVQCPYHCNDRLLF